MPRYGDLEHVEKFVSAMITRGEIGYAGVQILGELYAMPTADVEPVVHARWITDKNGVTVCSNCGEEHEWDEYRPAYCEDCGAKMDGKD